MKLGLNTPPLGKLDWLSHFCMMLMGNSRRGVSFVTKNGAVILAAVLIVSGCGGKGGYQVGSSSGYNTASSSNSESSSNLAPASVDTPPGDTITVDDDKFKSAIEYHSGVAKIGDLGDTVLWTLVAQKEKTTGATRYYVQWTNIYSSREWRFYSYANNDAAANLEMIPLGRNVHSCYSNLHTCLYDETYNIYFSKAEIEKGKSAGLAFKIFAKDGSSKVTTVPSTLVTALLTTMSGKA
jgi:hypothetical protein